jgi:hypothetical protein
MTQIPCFSRCVVAHDNETCNSTDCLDSSVLVENCKLAVSFTPFAMHLTDNDIWLKDGMKRCTPLFHACLLVELEYTIKVTHDPSSWN